MVVIPENLKFETFFSMASPAQPRDCVFEPAFFIIS